MGVAVAEAAIDRGAAVTLVVGRVEVPLPDRARVVRAETTSSMREAVLGAVTGGGAVPPADALVMAAAVADFRPARASGSKLTREGSLTLELEPTEDILAEVGAAASGLAPRPVLVGFAAETGSLERAEGKLVRKGVDLLVANDVTEPGSGFGTETNRVVVLDREGGRDAWPLLAKREVADRLLDLLARRLAARDAGGDT